MPQESKRISGYSYLRIAATVGVIVLHICSALVDHSEYYGLTAAEGIFYTAVWSVVRWAVPCFILLTGAIFLKKEKTVTLRDCLLKYVRRLVFALLLFGIPYAFLIEYYYTRSFSFGLIWNALRRVFSDKGFAHMWYLYMLIGLMLLLPLYKAFLNHCSRRTVEYVLAVLFFFFFLLPFLSVLFRFQIAFYLPSGTCYLFYMLMGGYLANYRPRFFERTRILIAGVSVLLLLFLGLSLVRPSLAFLFTEHNSPLLAPLCCGLFAIMQNIRKPASSRLWALDRLCFGAFLLHMLFLQVLYRVLKFTPTGSWFPLRFLAVAAILVVVSFGVSWVLNKIGPLRRYVL